MKRGFLRRAAAVVGAVGVMSTGALVAAPAASASEAQDPTGVYFCPEGWYGVIVGVQTPSGERYFTVCVSG